MPVRFFKRWRQSHYPNMDTDMMEQRILSLLTEIKQLLVNTADPNVAQPSVAG